MDRGAQVPPTAPEVVPVDLTGRTLGDFRVLRRLGQGGMGQVYLAEQLSLKRKVALKLLRPDLAANLSALQRFKQEAEAVARVNHANIVQVHAIGEVDGRPYMALEYVEGRNLREFLEMKGPPDLTLAVSIMRQGAAALARAGELGIIHRDIKPDNILLTRKGEVKVADFGLARCLDADQPKLNLTQSGVVMGTPLYMSPEQVEGKELDCRSDVYSFGITCYHMLTGRPPYTGAAPIEVALQHIQGKAVALTELRPDLPDALCAIVQKMMAPNPAARYQTGKDLLRDVVRLRDSLNGTGTGRLTEVSVELPAPPPTPAGGISTRYVVPSRGRLLPIAAVASILVAAGLGAALALYRHSSARSAARANKPMVEAPADVKQVEAILSKAHRREQALREALEQYLEPPGGAKEVTFQRTGYDLCLDLGLLYLTEHRLDDAEKFFTRLVGLHQVRPYHNLGRVGQAIVLALHSRAQESNALFREVVQPFRRAEGKKAGGADAPRWTDPRLRFWIAEALHYNARNGVPDSDVPLALRNLRAVTSRSEVGQPTTK
jgi:serine/threonine-protein kinase